MWLQLLLTSARNICQRHWKQAAFAHSSGVISANWEAEMCYVTFGNINLHSYQKIPYFGNSAPPWDEKNLQTLTSGGPFRSH